MDLGQIGRQAAIEKQAKMEGEHRVFNRSESLKNKSQGSQTPSGKSFVTALVDVVECSLSELIESLSLGKPGRHAKDLKLLQNLEPSVAAVVGLKAMINKLLTSPDELYLTGLAIYIGMAIEDEIQLRSFEEANPDLFSKVYHDLQQRNAGHQYARRKLRESAKRDGFEWIDWRDDQRWRVGVRLVDTVLIHTDLLNVSLVKRKDKKERFIHLTDYALKQMRDIELLKGLLAPKYYPMVCRPRHWKDVVGRDAGGFLTSNMPRQKLVKSHQKNYVEELRHFDLSEIYRSINALQDTSWKVNTYVKERFDYLWSTQSRLGNLPVQDLLDRPSKPFDIDTNEGARREYRKNTAIYFTDRQSQVGKIGIHDQLKTVSDKFVDEQDMHFVYTVDFRSRAYPKASYLQPQGNDVSRALLTFGDIHAKNMDEESARELALYGASLFGYDKVTLDERVAWVEDNTPDIIASAENCFDNRMWCEPGKPFLFLAFCNEWKQWKEKGEKHKSSFPVMRDGTCNAIQHWAAILRDTRSAVQVNLSDHDLPQDAYTEAAGVLKKKLEEHAFIGNETAKEWLEYGIDRALMKKPTMTLAYGSKQYSMMSHDYKAGAVESWVMDQLIEEDKPVPFDGKLNRPVAWLSKEIWASIGEVVGSVMIGMQFLQKCARVCLKADIPVTWITPSNFYVRQTYPEFTSRRVKTKLLGDFIRANIAEEVLGSYNKHKMVNAVAANFVHSLDATAMYKTIDKALDRDVTAFCMIHDSYGTVPADTKILSQCTREAFVEMYQDTNHLKVFKDQLIEGIPEHLHDELPDVPCLGDFDISKVLKSKHFFS